MSDINVDDFCKDAARALIALYSVFPRPITLFVNDIAGTFEPDEFGIPHKRHQACLATLLWLGEEGYLRYQDQIRQEAVDQAVLSARAFMVLNLPSPTQAEPALTQTSASLEQEQRSYINQLRQMLKARDSAALKNQLLRIMSLMLNRTDGI